MTGAVGERAQTADTPIMVVVSKSAGEMAIAGEEKTAERS
jgi:hypothetical protein